MISFTLPIEAKAWQRVKRNRYGIAYVPLATRIYKTRLKEAVKEFQPDFPFTGPLKLAVSFLLPKPKSVKREWPAVRPDIDNYLKGVLDAWNGVFWNDDGQIVEIHAAKIYGGPSIVVTIQQLDQEGSGS